MSQEIELICHALVELDKSVIVDVKAVRRAAVSKNRKWDRDKTDTLYTTKWGEVAPEGCRKCLKSLIFPIDRGAT